MVWAVARTRGVLDTGRRKGRPRVNSNEEKERGELEGWEHWQGFMYGKARVSCSGAVKFWPESRKGLRTKAVLDELVAPASLRLSAGTWPWLTAQLVVTRSQYRYRAACGSL